MFSSDCKRKVSEAFYLRSRGTKGRGTLQVFSMDIDTKSLMEYICPLFFKFCKMGLTGPARLPNTCFSLFHSLARTSISLSDRLLLYEMRGGVLWTSLSNGCSIIGNQAFQKGRCHICFIAGLDKVETVHNLLIRWRINFLV